MLIGSPLPIGVCTTIWDPQIGNKNTNWDLQYLFGKYTVYCTPYICTIKQHNFIWFNANWVPTTNWDCIMIWDPQIGNKNTNSTPCFLQPRGQIIVLSSLHTEDRLIDLKNTTLWQPHTHREWYICHTLYRSTYIIQEAPGWRQIIVYISTGDVVYTLAI